MCTNLCTSRPKINICLLSNKTLKDGTHPIALRYYDGKRYYLFIGYSCNKKQWNYENGRFRKNYDKHKEHNKVLLSINEKVDTIIDNYAKDDIELTYTLFKAEFEGTSKKATFFEFFEERKNSLKQSNKIGNYNIYKSTYSVFDKFCKNKTLRFSDINYSLLKRFEEHLRNKGTGGNGIAVHQRTLRAVFNSGIKEGYAKQEHYPFKSSINPSGYDISLLKEESIPRDLSERELKKLVRIDVSSSSDLQFSKDLFLLILYCKGINFKDLAKLTTSDIINGRITYRRSKTSKIVSIKITKEIECLLKKYSPKDTDYLVPILTANDRTELQKVKTIKNKLRTFNKYLKRIASLAGIETNLTSYTARHTYASTLKRIGVSTSIISESMAHSTESVTQIYLSKFENTVLDEANEKLIKSIKDTGKIGKREKAENILNNVN